MTLQGYVEQLGGSSRLCDLVATVTRPTFGAEPRELSLLFVLFYTAASGGPQTRRLLSAQLRHSRRRPGLPLHRRIADDRAEAGRPAPTAGRVRRAGPPTHPEPDTDDGRLRPLQRRADQPDLDDSPRHGGLGILFSFVGGDSARRYATMSRSRRRTAILAEYERFFGTRALHPRDFVETSWSGEQWTRGCPVGIPAVGALTAYGSRIREPIGRIHWAGTETATYWNGYMDRAVSSGRRAATEVLAEL